MLSAAFGYITTSVTSHPSLYGFVLLTLILLGLLALDYSKNNRAVKQTASKQVFLASYRDADGMPVYFDLDSYDPESPLYSTRRKRFQARTTPR